MNKRQKLVQQQYLDNEQAVIKRLEYIYDRALFEINDKIRNLEFAIGDLTEEYDWMDADDPARAQIKSKIQSKIYQKQYQQTLKNQVEGVLNRMQTEQFVTVSAYLDQCYEDGFIGNVFDLHGQGIPLLMPLDQTKMVRAIQLESKISKGLYRRLGEDVVLLKKRIAAHVTRSIATGATFAQMAKQLAGQTRIGYNNAVRIARTEGHRIQTTATMDVMGLAKDNGADVVKQWDAALDKRTRKSHQHVDGEIRELDEPFSNGLMFPGDPDGRASEVINCRCALLQRARWALDSDELETLKKRAKFYGLDKSYNFKDFKKKYLKAVEDIENLVKGGTIKAPKQYKKFETGEAVNDFFYYDEKRGLLAKKKSEYSQWLKKLSTDERECILNYTAGGYGDINDYFRKRGSWQEINADRVLEEALHIDSAISKFNLRENITVRRGVMNDVIDSLVDKYDIQNDLSELVGKRFVEEGYTSTTALFGNPVATSKPTVFEIEIPAGVGRGAYVNELSGFTDAEYEFLIRRGASFTITEVREDINTGEFYIKMVMDDD